MKLFTKAYVEKSNDSEDFSSIEVAVGSSNIIDRYGEVIDQDGWDLKNFKLNPQFLWAHNSRELPIGKITKIWFDGEGKGKKLMFAAKFDMEDDFAVKVARKFKDGFLNAFSVGFMPREWEFQEKKIEGEIKRVLVYTKSELFEISAVSVPANPDALKKDDEDILEKDFGFEIKDWVETKADLQRKLKETKEGLSECQLKKLKSEQENKAIKDLSEKVSAIENHLKQLNKNTQPVKKQYDKGIATSKDIETALKVLDQAIGNALKQIKISKEGEVKK